MSHVLSKKDEGGMLALTELSARQETMNIQLDSKLFVSVRVMSLTDLTGGEDGWEECC